MNARQRAFCKHYVLCLNASEAARRAGYRGKANVIGSRLLANDSIRALVSELMGEDIMTRSEVLYRLTLIGRGNLGDYLGENGLPDFEKFRENPYPVKRWRRNAIEMEDKLKALYLLGRAHGLFTERVKVDSGNWYTEAVELIQRGELGYNELIEALDPKILADELFSLAGVKPIVQGDENED